MGRPNLILYRENIWIKRISSIKFIISIESSFLVYDYFLPIFNLDRLFCYPIDPSFIRSIFLIGY